MATSELDIRERDVDGVTIITLAGTISLHDSEQLLRRHVHDLVDRGRTRIIADLAGVTFIDSAGVGMLCAKLLTVRQRGGDLRLSRLTARSRQLFGMLKLLTVFAVFDDEASALESFAGANGPSLPASARDPGTSPPGSVAATPGPARRL